MAIIAVLVIGFAIYWSNIDEQREREAETYDAAQQERETEKLEER